MLDAQRDAIPPKTIRLAEYQAPDFLIDTVDLLFELEETHTTVKARLDVRRNPAAQGPSRALRLDGEALTLVSVALNGDLLGPNRYQVDEQSLTIPDAPREFTLDIETRIEPQNNTELSGLYKSGGNFTTQCEAEGFRRITYFLDRPDVMARYTTTIVADAQRYPVLLSNGNPVDSGVSSHGRHWSKWQDPHPKPCYLFALVAGDLVGTRDEFTTRSGRRIDLAIWVRRGDEDKCAHAMKALKDSMRWDEEVFGLEYDLDVFNIVAVSDFNMGAMENKGLNIFNTKYILAKPETATDIDYEGIETVVAHEYFHNWTGNRVTCRDWFQLSLKEGLTVFRDQEFSCDQGSRAVKRIGEVRSLRARQFTEDAGPLAHPVRPESYIEINNFYTATVYQKGAEVVRMIHTLLGRENFRRGMDLYFQRHDNDAVTIEDFVAAMQDASGIDLSRFKRWYRQAGTPELTVREAWDAKAGAYELTLRQETKPTPGQADKEPLVIPVALGLLDKKGAELSIRLDGEAKGRKGTRLLKLEETEQTFRFTGLKTRPIPSLLRGFSAPVKLSGVPLEQLKHLAAHDTDPFTRWESGQQVATRLLLDLVETYRRGNALAVPEDFLTAQASTLAEADSDPAFIAEALVLPSEPFLADQMATVDVEAIHAVRDFVRGEIGRHLTPKLTETYERLDDAGPFQVDGLSIGRRALKNTALAYLAATREPTAIARAEAQFRAQRNMTDVLAALRILADVEGPARETALAQFYERWASEDLVIDNWFQIQAMSSLPGTIEHVRQLTRHPAFDLKNPNRVRALIGGLSMANPAKFHDASGAGYTFLADEVIALDAINGQIAARLVIPLGTWRRQDTGRQTLMKQALERVLATPNLSKGTFEMATKSLA
ncbi:aminopeptidase N [Aliidongia dinghuensis]|uniref:Aminopeptidase N n=1 Tax=Aliidongia dinghuensis TaxID=1867774 RepID=A0A8J3E1L9_9PROT|nr:aminopeptidase N [Aliidongia dinghuensis]GGF02230.1 aminopeptidase N [Aliidongia dinghuensis]